MHNLCWLTWLDSSTVDLNSGAKYVDFLRRFEALSALLPYARYHSGKYTQEQLRFACWEAQDCLNKHGSNMRLAMSVEQPQFVLPNYVAPQLTPPDPVPADARANNGNTTLQSNILESAQLIERPNTLIQGKTSSKDLDNLFGDD
ncbi:hypothetical protein [Nostoc sp. CHAB 5715]|uniref:hypothetical protein n=1 Tax=Nostoc sp. CHAB 5715 TaxID=2780400 RepID=UPI001E571AD6|nr:hypothetical protein [Nostoc sp. CHAB 5715]MCC5624727.1 hypothetical protein [Nostoc sp. CHAB 5715]